MTLKDQILALPCLFPLQSFTGEGYQRGLAAAAALVAQQPDPSALIASVQALLALDENREAWRIAPRGAAVVEQALAYVTALTQIEKS